MLNSRLSLFIVCTVFAKSRDVRNGCCRTGTPLLGERKEGPAEIRQSVHRDCDRRHASVDWRCSYDLQKGTFDMPAEFAKNNAEALVPE
jgi:hypothetical protein